MIHLTRRAFLKGSSALVAGVALEDAILKGTLYFFPKEIKLAKSYANSDYFVRVDTLVDIGPQLPNPEVVYYDKDALKCLERGLTFSKHNLIRREIFDPKDFYGDKYAVPIKVEYLSPGNVGEHVVKKLKGDEHTTASPKVVHNADGSMWTYDRPKEDPWMMTRNRDYGRIRLANSWDVQQPSSIDIEDLESDITVDTNEIVLTDA